MNSESARHRSRALLLVLLVLGVLVTPLFLATAIAHWAVPGGVEMGLLYILCSAGAVLIWRRSSSQGR